MALLRWYLAVDLPGLCRASEVAAGGRAVAVTVPPDARARARVTTFLAPIPGP